MFKLLLILLFFLVLPLQLTLSQEVKFGKVSKEELEEKFYPSDSSANAAFLYKKRRTYYDYTDQEGWVVITKVHERIKIYNKDGNKWATKNISLYTDGDNESVSIKAYTHNLVGSKIEKNKLKNSEVYGENVNKYWNRKKFTMPNLTEGSVVEWEYTKRSPYFWNIEDMRFQYKIPVKYVDSRVIIPEFFVFKNQSKGFFPIKINKSTKSSRITLKSKNRGTSSNNRTTQTTFSQDKVDFISHITECTSNNVPALLEEPYTNNMDNYLTSLDFELTAHKPKYSTHKYYNTTWEDVTKTIYNSASFGEQLTKTSYFKDDLASIVNKTSPINEKIGKVFQFVKSKIKWNGVNGKYTYNGVKKAYKEGVGNVADINLSLVGMLREVGLNANPILVSTRSHGIPLFPTSEGFNYVIAAVEIQDEVILLDATEKYSSPNVLPQRVLNWKGRMVRKKGSSIPIGLFSKNHTKNIIFMIVKIDNEGFLTGRERNSYNGLSALQYRSKYNNIAEDDIIATFEKNKDNIEINEFEATNKEDLSKSLTYQFGFESDNQVEIIGDKMYFSPLLFLAEKENPFKLEERKFPVDFGAPWEEKYSISIELPEGYILESKPENVAYELPDNLGSYKLVITMVNNKIQLLSNSKINSPIISPTHYGTLKEFYKKMIDKQLEKIVLIKSTP